MTTPLSDEQLDQLLVRYLTARHARTVGMARSASDAARLGLVRLGTPTDQRALRPAPGMRRLGLALALLGLLIALAAGAMLVGSAPSPGPQDLLSRLVTEPTDEPGVVRVLSDGVHDLSDHGGATWMDITIGGEGSVWVARDGLFRLGDTAELDQPGPWGSPRILMSDGLRSGPDGTLWTLRGAGSDGVGRLVRLDGQQLVVVREAVTGFDIAPDGTLWTLSTRGAAATVARLVDGTWFEIPIEPGRSEILWPGLAALSGTEALAKFDDGDRQVLVHIAGDTWEIIDPVGAGPFRDIRHLRAGTGGTAWVFLDRYLARYRNGTWTVFDESDGIPLPHSEVRSGVLRVGPDGIVWMSQCGEAYCPGIASFDGRTWTRHLPGVYPMDLEVGPDGAAWVVDGQLPGGPYTPGAVYRIDPAVRAAGGS